MNLISVYGSMYSLIKFIGHNADRSGLPLLVKKRLKLLQCSGVLVDLFLQLSPTVCLEMDVVELVLIKMGGHVLPLRLK